MDPLPHDPWLNGLSIVVVLGSVTAWVWIIWKWRTSGYVLQYEPRRRAPWGAGAALLPVVFVLLAISSLLGADEIHAAPDLPNSDQIAARIAAIIASQFVIVGGFFLVMYVACRATPGDLRLPRSVNEALRDVVIGIVACFAALLPVRIIQLILLWLMGQENDLSHHQLIEMLLGGEGVDVPVMLLACVSAVVVAPICEEVTFRLLFQGWLEKWEDGMVRMDRDGVLDTSTIQARNTTLEGSTEPPVMNGPVRRGIGGLPYGWLPIWASSLLFGLSHAGYGPEPGPLFLFAIILGYVFQRTGRILACIVAHALFNAVSMLALWRFIVQSAN
ncbi:MAG TPA: CPBP family intramembrane glutamic endopeptidase [Lacipirellulaceae bacterium]